MAINEPKERLLPVGGANVPLEEYVMVASDEFKKGKTGQINTSELLDAQVISTEAYRGLRKTGYKLHVLSLKLKNGTVLRVFPEHGNLELNKFEGDIGDVSIPR